MRFNSFTANWGRSFACKCQTISQLASTIACQRQCPISFPRQEFDNFATVTIHYSTQLFCSGDRFKISNCSEFAPVTGATPWTVINLFRWPVRILQLFKVCSGDRLNIGNCSKYVPVTGPNLSPVINLFGWPVDVGAMLRKGDFHGYNERSLSLPQAKDLH